MWRFTAKSSALHAALTGHTFSRFIATEFFGKADPQLVNLSVWPWMWAHELFGQPLGYNIVWLLSFILSGYGMYLLIRLLVPGENDWPALLSGLAYMLLPFHAAHAQGHFGAMHTEWLPLILAAGIYWLRKPRWWNAAIVGLLSIIQAWSEHHYFLWLAIALAVIAVFERQRLRNVWQQPAIRRQSIWLLAAFAIIIASYFPTFLLASSPTAALSLGEDQTIRFSADSFAYIIPAPFHSLWGTLADASFASLFTGNVAEATHFLGLTLLLSLVFFHQKIPARTWRLWLTIALTFYVISLGPRLHILGLVTPIPLPWAALQHLPIFDAIRTISRASIMVALAVCVLFAWVVRTQVKRPITVAILAICIVVEFLMIPTSGQSTALPPVYEQVKNMPGNMLIDIPAATNYTEASRALYASTFHGKEVLGDIALERGQDSLAFTIPHSYPVLRQILYLRTTDLRETRSEFFGQDLAETLPDVLRQLDVAGIVIHKNSLSALQVAALRNFLEKKVGLTPTEYPDEIFYAAHAGTVAHDGIFLVRGDGWGAVTRDVARSRLYAPIPQTATITIFNTSSQEAKVSLSAQLEGESAVHVVSADTSVDMTSGKPVELTIPPGQTMIRFMNQHSLPAVLINPLMTVNSAS
jgi:hypothetical protein